LASLIKNINIKFGRFILEKRIARLERNANFKNLSQSKSIGVIFNATHQDTYETARKYIATLQKRGLNVKALGFVDSKQVLDFYQKSVHFDYFSRKNLNWYGKPNNPNTDEFILSKFDILIDLSIIEDFPIQYVVGLSKADFKVGCVKDSRNFYDFMIELGEKKDLKYFIDQLNHYFEMIK
jgi:hypothetical protein